MNYVIIGFHDVTNNYCLIYLIIELLGYPILTHTHICTFGWDAKLYLPLGSETNHIDHVGVP
jgi:hypothetical protein